jgi:hypothetical protein
MAERSRKFPTNRTRGCSLPCFWNMNPGEPCALDVMLATARSESEIQKIREQYEAGCKQRQGENQRSD